MTRCSSIAFSERSCPITSPSPRRSSDGASGISRETNRSPNSVLGSSRAVTSAGIWSRYSGLSAIEIVAPSTSASTSRTSPTMTPRTLTSEASCSWLPAVSVSSVTMATSVNAFLYRATDSPSSSARTTRNASPCMRRRMTRPLPRVVLTRVSPRDPDSRRGSPDGQGQEQVDDVDRDDREADRAAHGQADTRGTAAGPVAVVAVGQDDHDREDQDFDERPEDVLRWQEQVEVVVVGAR